MFACFRPTKIRALFLHRRLVRRGAKTRVWASRVEIPHCIWASRLLTPELR